MTADFTPEMLAAARKAAISATSREGAGFITASSIGKGRWAALQLVPTTSPLLACAMAFDRARPEDFDEDAVLNAILRFPDLSFVMLNAETVLGAGGIIPLWSGRSAGWLFVSRFATRREIIAGTRAAREFLDWLQRNPEHQRVEMHVRAAAPWRQTFAAALGFGPPEALQHAWGRDGADHYLYARIADARVERVFA
jgi:hypothetical protein